MKSLKIGISGDYTVKSSEELFTNTVMQGKLLTAYQELSLGKKTLIFNNGINTSKYVHTLFTNAGYIIKHLDNTLNKTERSEVLEWFKETPDAILTSVSILTTGFDEPTVDTIILNRATKSLTLYFQMIGRGSRILPDKTEFTVIDLGNNVARFGVWSDPVDWDKAFKYPNYYYDNLVNDEDIERNFVYKMPDTVSHLFSKSKTTDFDIKKVYKEVISQGHKSKKTLELSVEQHAQMCVENAEDIFDARLLSKTLKDDISYRVRLYSYCIMNNTNNYKEWLEEDYMRKLRSRISQLSAAVH